MNNLSAQSHFNDLSQYAWRAVICKCGISCRILSRIQCARLGVRLQREQAGPHPAHVRAERVLLPSERDLLNAEERVHRLGQAGAEPAQRPRRHLGGNCSIMLIPAFGPLPVSQQKILVFSKVQCKLSRKKFT